MSHLKQDRDYSPNELNEPERYSFTAEGTVTHFSEDEAREVILQALKTSGLVNDDTEIHVEKEMK